MAMGLMLLHALEEEVGFILQGQQILIFRIPEEEDFNKVEQVGVEIMLMAGQAINAVDLVEEPPVIIILHAILLEVMEEGIVEAVVIVPH